MMRVFLDCEFTDLIGIDHDPALISVGLVSQSGKDFYAELSDTWTEAICNDFVMDIVLPALQGGEARVTEAEAAARLKAWIEAFGEPVQIYSDAPNFDWPPIVDLLRHAWPVNLVRSCERVEMDTPLAWSVEDAFWQAAEKRGGVRHHALWDARSVKAVWLASTPSGLL